MPSPFPGMNPYLEQPDTWEDFHTSFITHARDSLSPQVGANYLVKIEVRLYLRELAEEERRYFGRADVAVTVPVAAGAVEAGAAPELNEPDAALDEPSSDQAISAEIARPRILQAIKPPRGLALRVQIENIGDGQLHARSQLVGTNPGFETGIARRLFELLAIEPG